MLMDMLLRTPLPRSRFAVVLSTACLLMGAMAMGPQPAVGQDLYVDASNTSCPGSGTSGDPYCSIQTAVDNASTGDVIDVAAGTYAENVTVSTDNLTLQGPTSGTATLDATSGTAPGIVVSGTNGATITDLSIQATPAGIVAEDITTTSSTTLTITNNTLTFPGGQEFEDPTASTTGVGNDLGEQAIGIQISDVSGPTAPVIEDNVIGNTSTPFNGPFYGYALFDVQADDPTVIEQTTSSSATINGVQQGVAVLETDGSTTAPSDFRVEGVIMDNFTGTSNVTAINFHAGVYVFTSTLSTPITGTIQDVEIRNTGAPQPNSAGLSFSDFGGDDGNTRQNITVERATLTGNDNRGIYLRGPGATATVTDSELTGNGDAPFTAGGNNGYSAIARNDGNLTIETSLITGPGSVTTSGSPDDNDLIQISAGGNVTVTRSRLDRNGIGDYITTSGGGDLDASGNAFASEGSGVDPRTASGIASGADISPFIIPPNTDDEDPSTIGFQGDFSELAIDNGIPQTGTETREAEALDLLAGPEESQRLFVFQTGTNVYEELTVNDRTILIVPGESGGPLRVTDLTYDGEPGGSGSNLPNLEVEDITINGSFPFTEGSSPTITVVNGEIVPNVSPIGDSPTFNVQQRFTGQDGSGSSTTLGNDAGWRILSSPRADVSSGAFANLQDASEGSILYTWDGGAQDFVPRPPSDAENLTLGEGFFLYLFDIDDPITSTPADGCGTGDACVGVSGPLDDATNGFPLSDVDVNIPAGGNPTAPAAGYVLGNPFAQSFDLSHLTVDGAGALGSQGLFEATVQAWDPNTNQFVPITEGMDDQIAPWQGFWILRQVGATTDAATLTFESDGRTSGAKYIPQPLATDRVGTLALDLTVDTGDEMVTSTASVYARDAATTGEDAYDASRIAPPLSAYAQVSFLREDRTRKVQESLPYDLTEHVEIPLHAEGIGLSGTATISTEDWTNIPSDWNLKLEDTETGDQVPLTPGQTYQFNLSESGSGSGGLGGVQGGSVDNARFVVRIGPNAPLPVELTSFTASTDGSAAVLSWSTASETNNAGFNVQRKTETSFETLRFVEGHGTTDTPRTYRIRLKDLAYGPHTFRLQQVDLDGTSSVSDSVSVEVQLQTDYDVSRVAPNPMQGRSQVEVAVRDTGPVTLALYDLLGRRIETLHTGRLEGGRTHRFTIDADGLASGTYFLRMEGAAGSDTQRVTVVR